MINTALGQAYISDILIEISTRPTTCIWR